MTGIGLLPYGHIAYGKMDSYIVERCLEDKPKATLYVASSLNTGLEVVLKQEHRAFNYLRGLEREAVMQILIQQGGGHQNILSSCDLIKDEQMLAFPYIEAETLKDFQKKIRKFTPQQALSIVMTLCDAVEYLHSLGIVHRDIKRDNVLLQADEAEMPISDLVLPVLDLGFITPKLYDFDLSWHQLVSHFDEEGSCYGTMNYMAPEVWREEKTEKLQDIYALGVVLYELLAGVSPFARKSRQETVLAHLNGDFVDVKAYNMKVTPGLSSTITKALAWDREMRHQSAAELKEELEQVRHELQR